MLIRRMIGATHEMKSESMSMVFLDWAKAFDRIRGDSLLKALRRFGLPEQFVNMIGAIYVERKFFIQLLQFFISLLALHKDVHFHHSYLLLCSR